MISSVYSIAEVLFHPHRQPAAPPASHSQGRPAAPDPPARSAARGTSAGHSPEVKPIVVLGDQTGQGVDIEPKLNWKSKQQTWGLNGIEWV